MNDVTPRYSCSCLSLSVHEAVGSATETTTPFRDYGGGCVIVEVYLTCSKASTVGDLETVNSSAIKAGGSRDPTVTVTSIEA